MPAAREIPEHVTVLRTGIELGSEISLDSRQDHRSSMAPEETPLDTGFARRIQDVLERRDMSTNAFHEELKAAKIPGSGYSSVYRYVKGQQPPPVAFVEAAARVPKVRAAWLAFGEEPENPAVTPARKGMTARISRHDTKPIGVADIAHPAGEPIMIELVSKLRVAQPPDAPDLSEDDISTPRALSTKHLVTTFLGALTPKSTGGPDGSGGRSILLSLMAMLAAVPGPNQGRQLAKVLAMLPQAPRPRDHLELRPLQEDVDDEQP